MACAQPSLMELTDDQSSRSIDCPIQELIFQNDRKNMSLEAMEFELTTPSMELQQPVTTTPRSALISKPSYSEYSNNNQATELSAETDQATANQDPTDDQPQKSRQAARKRAPKAPAMSAKKWEPADNRIRQLFVHEARTYKEVTSIINREFGFTATERQFKARICQMKLKRNMEAAQKTALIRHIQYRREILGKATKYVRVNSHRKSEAVVQQWMKEYSLTSRPTPNNPPSPLPSQISLRTESQSASHVSATGISSGRGITETLPDIALPPYMDTPVTRLISHAHMSDMVISTEQCGAIFNDFQRILSSGLDIQKRSLHDIWHPTFNEFLVTIRNWMNLTRNVRLAQKIEDSIRVESCIDNEAITSSPRVIRRYGARRTPYGTVSVVFKQIRPFSENHCIREELSRQDVIAAQLAIHPNNSCAPSHRIVLDLDPSLNPLAMISYQAIIPNDSEIFRIIEHGTLEDFIKGLEDRKFGLTDRDEDGRSLLNYANAFARVDFVRFLLKTSFDPDAIELHLSSGMPKPVFQAHQIYTFEHAFRGENNEIYNISERFRLMIEAGADVESVGYGESNLESILFTESSTSLRHVIQYGGSFLNLNVPVEDYWNGPGSACSPLIRLTQAPGHGYGDSYHILEKAIILLKWGADISCRDCEGNTVLHQTLRACRSEFTLTPSSDSAKERELLIVFLAAGADVYALNKSGYSPSRLAKKYGREKEWSEALEFCGFDAKLVMNQTMPKHVHFTGFRQTPKLAFEEYYRDWDENKWAKKMNSLDAYDLKCNHSERKFSATKYEWRYDYDFEPNDCEDGYGEDSSSDGADSGSTDSKDIDDLHNQLQDHFTPEALKLASGIVYEDSSYQTDNLVDDYYDLKHTYHFSETTLSIPIHTIKSPSMKGPEQTNHADNTTTESTIANIHDPMISDDTQSTIEFWRNNTPDHQIEPDQTSLANANYFEEMEGIIEEEPFQTVFDTFLYEC